MTTQKTLKKISSFTNIMDPNEIIDGEDHNSDANIADKFSKVLNLNHKKVKSVFYRLEKKNMSMTS